MGQLNVNVMDSRDVEVCNIVQATLQDARANLYPITPIYKGHQLIESGPTIFSKRDYVVCSPIPSLLTPSTNTTGP